MSFHRTLAVSQGFESVALPAHHGVSHQDAPHPGRVSFRELLLGPREGGGVGLVTGRRPGSLSPPLLPGAGWLRAPGGALELQAGLVPAWTFG